MLKAIGIHSSFHLLSYTNLLIYIATLNIMIHDTLSIQMEESIIKQ